QDGSVQSRIFAEEHLDGQSILLYDSEKGVAEPRRQWATLFGDTLNTEIAGLTDIWEDLGMALAAFMTFQDQKKASLASTHGSMSVNPSSGSLPEGLEELGCMMPNRLGEGLWGE
ncbi:MHC class I polypeptide-related sequence B-like, partial [Erinaceus europaeus]|uniref:MHC class I polypeptide-related sequence B-like n=1 Tax=Erinaceus europaeus TaxID=9365 RepID=A0A1S3WNG1_ERIEU